MKLLLLIFALVLLLAALLIAFCTSGDKALRERLMSQSGRARVPMRAQAPNLIARKTRDTGWWSSTAGWLGLHSDNLPLRRLSVPLVLVLASAVGGVATWAASTQLPLPGALVAGFAAVLGSMRYAYVWEVGRHRDIAFKQIPDALGLMVRAVRSGLPVAEAVRSVAREMPEPTRSEFQRIIAETSLGGTLERALWGVHERTALREYAFLSVVIGLQSQTGGGLAESLENIADIVRKRVAMAAKAQALAAQSKASAAVLIGLPPFAGAGVGALNPGYLDILFYDPRGLNLLAYALGMLLMGTLVIRMMIKKATAE